MMNIMRTTKRPRAALKQESLNRILEAGARRLRTDGIDRAAIVPVMQDAGLTHGAFYSHFASKDELAKAAFAHAITTGRPHWVEVEREPSWGSRLKRLALQYLNPQHRDSLADSCAFAAVASDAARASVEFREAYETELRITLDAICKPFASADAEAAHGDQAIALMALCVGGLSLSRAVADRALSERILRVCQETVAALADAADGPHSQEKVRPGAKSGGRK